MIMNRDRLVAVVMDASMFQEFAMWQSEKTGKTLEDVFTEVRRICAEENYSFEAPPRRNRSNAFAEAIDQLAEHAAV